MNGDKHRGPLLVLGLLFSVLTLQALAPRAALAQQRTLAQETTLATAPSLDGLLSRFAHAPGFVARFVEEKRIALLALPVTSEGMLYFDPPGRLLRRVSRPQASVTLIDGGNLTMRTGEQVETLSIGSNPTLRAFIDSFRAVLAGDRPALERYYEAELSAGAQAGEGDAGWVLVLRPRQASLRRFLREIRLQGQGTHIAEMRMVEVNGDQTRTHFHDVDSEHHFSAAEARRLFRIE